jgi:hypothetical protein
MMSGVDCGMDDFFSFRCFVDANENGREFPPVNTRSPAVDQIGARLLKV